MVPGLETHLVEISEEEVIVIADLVTTYIYISSISTYNPFEQVQKNVNSARADDTKGMKSAVVNWITPKGQSLNPHISQNIKCSRGFNHECTGALLYPAGLNWANFKYMYELLCNTIDIIYELSG